MQVKSFFLALLLVFSPVVLAESSNTLREVKREKLTMLGVPLPQREGETEEQQVYIEQGKYLVELLGCASCHTDGVLRGAPDMERQLAGSSVGIALANPTEVARPAVAFPSNITPDNETGIGRRTDEQLHLAIRHGIVPGGASQLPIMPWPVYAGLTDDDLRSIVAYLRAIKPVRHKVPAAVKRGQKHPFDYVYFGIYYSDRSMLEEDPLP